MLVKISIILGNALASVTLAAIGLRGMLVRDPLLGTGYEWSTLMWIVGLVTLFFIPLEICVIKTRKRED